MVILRSELMIWRPENHDLEAPVLKRCPKRLAPNTLPEKVPEIVPDPVPDPVPENVALRFW